MDYDKDIYASQSVQYYELNNNNFVNSLKNLLLYPELSEDEKKECFIKPENVDKYPDIYDRFDDATKNLNISLKKQLVDVIVEELVVGLGNQLLRFAKIIAVYDLNVKKDILLLKFTTGLSILHGSKKIVELHVLNNSLYYDDIKKMMEKNEYNLYLTDMMSLSSFYSNIMTAEDYGLTFGNSTPPEIFSIYWQFSLYKQFLKDFLLFQNF